MGIYHIKTKCTLHFIIEKDKFDYRCLWLWDDYNNLTCDNKQLTDNHHTTTIFECDTTILDQAMATFNTKQFFSKFLSD